MNLEFGLLFCLISMLNPKGEKPIAAVGLLKLKRGHNESNPFKTPFLIIYNPFGFFLLY